jgi:hypothetical protein
MMTKTQFFCFTALLFVICSLFPTGAHAQTCTLEEKYWAYRKNLNEKFVRVDRGSLADGYHDTDGIGVPVKNSDGSYLMPIRFTKNGYSTPMDAYDSGTNRLLSSGDNTVTLGNYLKTLALEYQLLKNAGDTINAKKTLDEIFLAQQALRRLDKSANLFLLEEGKKQNLDTIVHITVKDSIDQFGNIVLDPLGNVIRVKTGTYTATSVKCDSLQMNKDIDTSGFSGFFYRSDAVWYDTNIGTANHTTPSGFWDMEDAYQKEDGGKFNPKNKKALNFPSEDQIFGLINGLAMVKRMIEPAKTAEEKKVLENANRQLVGLIVQALSVIKLKGCWDGGKLQGNGAQLMHRNELMRVATDLGLLPAVLVMDPSMNAVFYSIIADNQALEKLLLGGCVPQNSFQPNHFMRLNAISPAKIGYIPNNGAIPILYDSTARNQGLLFLNNVANDAHKPSFALESILFNPNMPAATKKVIQDAQCDKMKKLLDNAPCCGPCVNCAARPSSLFEKVPKMCKPNGDEIVNLPNTFLNNLKESWKSFIPIVGIGFAIKDAVVQHNATPCKDANGNIRYESYQYVKPDTYDLGWFSDDTNANSFPCDRQRDKGYIWGDVETYYNGLDFMQDYMLWLMACGSGSEDEKPKLTQPNPLVEVGGCENVGKVHIQGPDVVCKGETAKFNISTGGVHTPVEGNPNWSLEGNIIKGTGNNPNGDKDMPQFMNNTNITFPNSTGTQTISYQFSVGNGGIPKTITKTVSVIDGPPSPTLSGTYTNNSKCLFEIKLNPQEDTEGFMSSGSTSGNVISFDMSDEPYEVTIYAINKCGKSEPFTYVVPAAMENCRERPRIVKTGTSNIDPLDILIFANPSTKTISVKSEVLYLAPFDCRLYDMMGRLVVQQTSETSDITIDYSSKDLASGLYIFNLSSGGSFIKSVKFYLENY